MARWRRIANAGTRTRAPFTVKERQMYDLRYRGMRRFHIVVDCRGKVVGRFVGPEQAAACAERLNIHAATKMLQED